MRSRGCTRCAAATSCCSLLHPLLVALAGRWCSPLQRERGRAAHLERRRARGAVAVVGAAGFAVCRLFAVSKLCADTADEEAYKCNGWRGGDQNDRFRRGGGKKRPPRRNTATRRFQSPRTLTATSACDLRLLHAPFARRGERMAILPQISPCPRVTHAPREDAASHAPPSAPRRRSSPTRYRAAASSPRTDLCTGRLHLTIFTPLALHSTHERLPTSTGERATPGAACCLG